MSRNDRDADLEAAGDELDEDYGDDEYPDDESAGDATPGAMLDDRVDLAAAEDAAEGNDDVEFADATGEGDETGGEQEVYLPGDALPEGETLVCDLSVYHMLTEFTTDWPCLSFDFLRDSLGNGRTEFPATVFLAAGTQAAQAKLNKLHLIKVSNINKMKKSAEESDDDDDSDDSASNDGDDSGDEGAALRRPMFTCHSINHLGAVNRVRADKEGALVATWSDTGCVHLWDVSKHVAALDGGKPPKVCKPVFSFEHSAEGFALDWSKVVQHRLATGTTDNSLHIWNVREGGTWAVSAATVGHAASVEDLQWSPHEANVLASACADGSVRIWDARAQIKCAITLPAHKADVNAVSWNRLEQHLLATGCEDGTLSVWDLRHFPRLQKKESVEPLASFAWHRGPIHSVEWHATDPSVLAASGDDDQVTIWDLAVEAEDVQSTHGRPVPPQLLFIHQGQKTLKEIHWHPQIPGVLGSTAESNFNIFKTISA